MLPPQRLLGDSEVPLSIHPFWDWLVKEEMLSDRSLNITILDVRRIIRHFRDGVFFPREILALDDSCELARRVGIVASLHEVIAKQKNKKRSANNYCQTVGTFRRRAPGSKTEENIFSSPGAGGAGCPRRRGVPPDPNLRPTGRLETDSGRCITGTDILGRKHIIIPVTHMPDALKPCR
jgi:hypothetical protein